ADAAVSGERRRLGADPVEAQLDLRDLTAAAGHEGQQRGAREQRRRRPQVERQDRRRAVQGPRRHAPSRFWPQTRTTLPLIAVEAGLANQAIASATSTGRPPW